MISQTMKVTKPSEIRKTGTQALINALGPIGLARYLEEYDNGGNGDYTKEKYEQPDYSIAEILANKKTYKSATTITERKQK